MLIRMAFNLAGCRRYLAHIRIDHNRVDTMEFKILVQPFSHASIATDYPVTRGHVERSSKPGLFVSDQAGVQIMQTRRCNRHTE